LIDEKRIRPGGSFSLGIGWINSVLRSSAGHREDYFRIHGRRVEEQVLAQSAKVANYWVQRRNTGHLFMAEGYNHQRNDVAGVKPDGADDPRHIASPPPSQTEESRLIDPRIGANVLACQNHGHIGVALLGKRFEN
jgi:hypothetical protein